MDSVSGATGAIVPTSGEGELELAVAVEVHADADALTGFAAPTVGEGEASDNETILGRSMAATEFPLSLVATAPAVEMVAARGALLVRVSVDMVESG